MDIVSRIIEVMEKKQINGVQLSKILGKKKSPVTDWKNGVSKPTLDQIIIICEKLAISSDYLLFGQTAHITSYDFEMRTLQFKSISQKIDYKNKSLHLKDDTFFTRFREAREAAGISISDAAAGAFLSEDTLRLLEDDDIPILEIDIVLDKISKIGYEQLSYLAYRYNVDLYWLLCGKVRPPAAIVQDGSLVFPPYDFMLDSIEVTPEPITYDEDWKKPENWVPYAAQGEADITPEKEEFIQKKLQAFERRAREMKARDKESSLMKSQGAEIKMEEKDDPDEDILLKKVQEFERRAKEMKKGQ